MWSQFLENTRGVVRVKNETGVKIPARSIVRVLESTEDSNNIPYFRVGKPTEDEIDRSSYLFTMEIDIPNGDYGHAYLPSYPVLVKYDSSNPVAVNDIVGPVADSFEVSDNGGGFFVSEINSSKYICRVTALTAASTGMKVVRTISSHPQGASQDCEIYEGLKGSETSTGRYINCFNRFGDLDAGKNAIAAYVVNGWELLAAEC